jgi:uncharacterized membrane protein
VEESRAAPPLNRMLIAVLALIGVLLATYLTLHRFGFIGSLVCGTGSCETVQASQWATFLGVPVPVIGLLGYVTLFVVALLGIQTGWQHRRGLGLVLFLLADAGILFTLYLSYLEMYVIHAWCRWCIGSAIIATLIWLLSLAELPRLRRAEE